MASAWWYGMPYFGGTDWCRGLGYGPQPAGFDSRCLHQACMKKSRLRVWVMC